MYAIRSYYEVKADMLSAQYAYNDAKSGVEVKVKNMYNDIQTSGEALKLAKRYEKLMDDQLKAIELKYNNGMVTNEEVLAVREKKLAARYETFKAIYDLNILIEDRITSYNVCYTKLLRYGVHPSIKDQ